MTFIQQTVVQGGQIITLLANPVAPPPGPTQPALAVNLATTDQFIWDVANQVWIKIAGGGAGGSGQIYHFQGAASGFPNPANPNAPAINYDDSNGGFMNLWNTATQLWY